MNIKHRILAYALADDINRKCNICAYVVHNLDIEIQYTGCSPETLDNPQKLIDEIERYYFNSRLYVVKVDIDSFTVTYRIKKRSEWV